MTIEERNKYIEDAWQRINKYIHREVGKMFPGGISFCVDNGISSNFVRCRIVIIPDEEKRDVVLLYDYNANCCANEGHFVFSKNESYASRYNFYKLESIKSVAKRVSDAPYENDDVDQMRRNAIICVIKDWQRIKEDLHKTLEFEKSLIDFRP